MVNEELPASWAGIDTTTVSVAAIIIVRTTMLRGRFGLRYVVMWFSPEVGLINLDATESNHSMGGGGKPNAREIF
jgi:hypothetical protein